MMKRFVHLLRAAFMLMSAVFFWLPSAAASSDPYPFNATAEMVRKTDSLTLIYRLDLYGHRPEEKIIGHMKVFDERDTLRPLVDFSVKELSAQGEDEKQIAFLIPGAPGEGASFFRQAKLVYDKWNHEFRFTPAYRSTPAELDAYVGISASQFRLKAHLRPTSAEELPSDQRVEKKGQSTVAAAKNAANGIAADSVGQSEKADWRKYLGDGTWKGNLRARDQLYKSTGFRVVIGVVAAIFLLFFIWMFPKARKSQQIVPLLIALFCFTMVNFDGFYPFWVVLPGFLVAYPRLYSQVYPLSFVKVLRLFVLCSVGVFVVLSLIFYQIWGWSSIREMVGWAFAGILFWYFLSLHLGRSCCRMCGAYGHHKKLSEKLVKREVRTTRLHKDTFDRTEVRSDEIIDWYRRKYGVRIDITETFNVYYECLSCGHIFKNQENKYKSKEKW